MELAREHTAKLGGLLENYGKEPLGHLLKLFFSGIGVQNRDFSYVQTGNYMKVYYCVISVISGYVGVNKRNKMILNEFEHNWINYQVMYAVE